jgi:hypothetical protein
VCHQDYDSSLLTQDLVTHIKSTWTCENLLEKSTNRSRQQHTGLTDSADRSKQPRRDTTRNPSNVHLGGTRQGKHLSFCPTVDRPARMPSIRLDEGVIEIRVGKVGQRDKNMKRQKIKEKYFFCFDWDCPQSVVALHIYRVGGLALQGII